MWAFQLSALCGLNFGPVGRKTTKAVTQGWNPVAVVYQHGVQWRHWDDHQYMCVTAEGGTHIVRHHFVMADAVISFGSASFISSLTRC
jgi:hypothetical protein